MANKFESNCDKIFLKRKEFHIKVLVRQFGLDIVAAENRTPVLNFISNYLSKLIEHEYNNSTLNGEVNNSFIHDIIIDFPKALDWRKIDPVKYFIGELLPNIRKVHLTNFQSNPDNYHYRFRQYFLIYNDVKLLLFLAKQEARKEFQNVLFDKKRLEKLFIFLSIGLNTNGKEIAVVAKTIFKHLSPTIISVEIKEFLKHFNPKVRFAKPIKWNNSTRLFVYLINQLKLIGMLSDENRFEKFANHFIDERGKPFKSHQFPQIANDTVPETLGDIEIINGLISELKTFML